MCFKRFLFILTVFSVTLFAATSSAVWLTGERRLSLWDIDPAQVENRPILTADHCFGCTAGSGSSCGGALL